MKMFVAATLAFLSFVRAEDNGGNDGDDGDHEYYDELDPCRNYTSSADCLTSTETEDERGLRLECAWVARRHTEYCWICTQEEIDAGECWNEGENCKYVEEDYVCGGCRNIFSGEAFSDYTCAEVRERRYGQDSDGDDKDLKIFCRDDLHPVPAYLDTRCKHNHIPWDDKERCHEAMCQAEMDACFDDEGDYNCSDLAKKVFDDEKQWKEDCECYDHDDNNATNCDEMHDWCRDNCPGDFKEESDGSGYECRDVAVVNIAHYCADDETERVNYADACVLLKDFMGCDHDKCGKGFCTGGCTQENVDCMFAADCWNEYKGFEDYMDEQGVDPGEGGGGPFVKYEMRKTADDYCAQLDAGVCVDELNTLFDCALEHCLKRECLVQDCDELLQTCYDSEDCMNAANFSIQYLFPDDGDKDEEEGGGGGERRRLIHATDECCKEGCNTGFWDNCQWLEGEFECDLCQTEDRCCAKCQGYENAYCSDDSFNCDECNDGGHDGGCGQPRRKDDDNQYLMINYLKWWYEYQCESEGRYCANAEWTAVLDCSSQMDGSCAHEFGRKNKCFADEECTPLVNACFELETCGTEFDEWFWYEENCEKVENKTHLSAEDQETCFGWEEDYTYKEVAFQQHQCWRDGGCTQAYEDLWSCVFPCLMGEDDEGHCHWSEEDQKCHCKHDEDDDAHDGDDDDGECFMEGCSEPMANCFFDEECYSDMDYLFNDYNISHMFQWLMDEMDNEDCAGISEQEITDWYEDNFCTQLGVTCNALFKDLWECFVTECVLTTFPCWYDSCFGLVCECFYDDECSELGGNAFGDDDDEDTRRLIEPFVTTEGGDKHFFDIFEDIDVPDAGSAQDAADWVAQVYTDACADASGCGNQKFEDAIECIATECVHSLPGAVTTDGPKDSALAASTALSFLAVLFAAML